MIMLIVLFHTLFQLHSEISYPSLINFRWYCFDAHWTMSLKSSIEVSIASWSQTKRQLKNSEKVQIFTISVFTFQLFFLTMKYKFRQILNGLIFYTAHNYVFSNLLSFLPWFLVMSCWISVIFFLANNKTVFYVCTYIHICMPVAKTVWYFHCMYLFSDCFVTSSQRWRRDVLCPFWNSYNHLKF